MLGQEETVELIKRAQNGDEIAKETLVLENSPLIKSVIRWFRDKGIEYDDLYQLGCLGFLKAINRFDCSFNVKFSTYVVPMIVGEIKRFMRDDGAVKVSRALKTLNIKISKFCDKFMSENGEKPNLKQIAENFCITEQEVVLAMDSAKMPVSIYSPIEDESEDGLTMIDRLEVENGEDFVDRVALRDLISGLNERDKNIVLMRYFDDKTQSEIAQALGVSQVQVSRLENRILKELGKKLKT